MPPSIFVMRASRYVSFWAGEECDLPGPAKTKRRNALFARSAFGSQKELTSIFRNAV